MHSLCIKFEIPKNKDLYIHASIYAFKKKIGFKAYRFPPYCIINTLHD